MSTSGTQSISGLLGSSLISQSSTSSSTSSAEASAFDMNSFMKMFLTQLQCQDPTNPMQSYELAAQLAQFSTVEQLSQASTTLSNIQSYQAATNDAAMASLVGKEVTANQSTINVSSGNASTLGYNLGSAANVTVSIKDSNNNVIYTNNVGSQNAGNYTVGWNGKDTQGNSVADGTYTCTVTAVNGTGNSTTVPTTIQGQVYSLTLNANSPYYTLSGPNGTQVAASNVVQIGTTSN